MAEGKVFRSTKWMAEIFGKTPETIIAWIHDPDMSLPAKKIGREYMFVESEVYEWADQHSVVVAQESQETLPQAVGE